MTLAPTSEAHTCGAIGSSDRPLAQRWPHTGLFVAALVTYPGWMRTGLILGCIGVLGLACGSVSKNDPDGGNTVDGDVVDGAAQLPDARGPDAQTHGSVTVFVFTNGNPANMIPVMYHDTDGSYLGSVSTDSSGMAVIADMPAGGAVTAPVAGITGISAAYAGVLTTIKDVQIGDTLTIGKSRTFGARPTSLGNLSIRTPPTAVIGATTYAIHGGCDRRTTSLTAQSLTPNIFAGCLNSSGAADVVGYAQDAQGTRLAAGTITGINVTGTPPNMTGSSALTSWNAMLANHTVTVSNAPEAVDVTPTYALKRQGATLEENQKPEVSLTAGTGSSFSYQIASGFYDQSITTVAADYNVGVTSWVTLGGGALPTNAAATTTTVDLTTDLFPKVTNVAISTTTPYVITWDAAGGLTCGGNAPDQVVGLVAGDTGGGQTVSGGGPTAYLWMVVAPGTSPNVQLPALDPAVAFTLWPTGSFNSVQAAAIFTEDSTTDYDAVRVSDDVFTLYATDTFTTGTRCVLQTLIGGGGSQNE